MKALNTYQCDQPNIYDLFEKPEVTVKVTEIKHKPHTFRTLDDKKSYFLYEKFVKNILKSCSQHIFRQRFDIIGIGTKIGT